MKKALINFVDISKSYNGNLILDEFNLYVRENEFVTLLGPSGCGKTTTLRLLGGFEMPDKGKIYFDSEDITHLPANERKLNTVFQKYALFPHLNVFENVAFGLKQKRVETTYVDKKGNTKIKKEKLPKAIIAEKVKKALEVVDLAGFEKRSIATLSGGQQQRIAIARAIVNEPEILLLDEPLGALDLKMRKEMQLELKAMHKRLGITFIYVTHDQEEALTMSDVIVVLNDGYIQQVGTPKKIYDEPANAFVANFIGESNILSGVMLKDYIVKFLDKEFECLDKGFLKNEKVDLVIRPEDIKVYAKDSGKGQFTGVVTSSVFKGTYYEMNVLASEYEFTVQNTTERKTGEEVELKIVPDSIHIMRKLRTVNEFKGMVSSENTVTFCGGEFEFVNDGTFEKGDEVNVKVPFDGIEITDDENDGIIGANITQALYKGTYYQVQIYSDTDEDFYTDPPYEWDIDDRVGIKIAPEKITLEKVEEDVDEA